MLNSNRSKTVGFILSPLIIASLLLNVFVTPVDASGSVRVVDCPDSLFAMGTQEIHDFLAQFESALDVETSAIARSRSDSDGEAGVDASQQKENGSNVSTGSSSTFPDEGHSSEGSLIDETSQSVKETSEENQGFLMTLREVWEQIRELQITLPDLSFEEARQAWGQIRELRMEMPDLSFEEARQAWEQIQELKIASPDLGFEEVKQVWEQIRVLRVEMPDLSFEEAKQAWEQIRELQIASPDLGFEEVKHVWEQIRVLRVEMPDLNFEKAKEAWEQIRELQIALPDLSFEEARQATEQIRELQIALPDLSFEEVKQVWEQIREIRLGLPDLSFEEAEQVWSQIRELQNRIPDLSFVGAREAWVQIRNIQIELPAFSLEEAEEVWNQIRELRSELSELSFEEAKEAWGQIQGLQVELSKPSLEEAKQVWTQIRELQNHLTGLSFERAKEIWDQLPVLRKEFPDIDFEYAKEISSQIRALQLSKPLDSFEGRFALWLQIRELSEHRTPFDSEELRVAWDQIRELRDNLPELSIEEARKAWFDLQEFRREVPELNYEEVIEIWTQTSELPIAALGFSGVLDHSKEKADRLLQEFGFRDTDGDGILNWPPGSPFDGENFDVELTIGNTAGIAIAFVPIAGDVVDGAALVIGRDPFTGECLTTTEQILLVIAIILVLPISVRSVKIIGQQLDRVYPLVKRLLVRSISELPVSARRYLLRDLVDPTYNSMRSILGEDEVSTDILVKSLGLKSISNHNYREALLRFTGVSKDYVKGFEAHHILPQELEESFLEAGIDSINDPRLLVWVEKVEHQKLSKWYGEAWRSFFNHNPSPNKREVLVEAQRLAEEWGYHVLFRTPG